jgi:hypothetical protein
MAWIAKYRLHGDGLCFRIVRIVKMAAFWVVAPCSLVGIYQRFRGPGGLRPEAGGSKDLCNVG